MEFWLKILTYSLPAGRVMGIPLRVNWLLLVFLPFLIEPFLSVGVPKQYALLMGIMFVAILYGSILLHELGHAWGTRLVGNTVREIQLTPLGGIAIGEGRNASPRAELLVIGLGPAVSIILATLGWVLTLSVRQWDAMPWLVVLGAMWLFRINMMLALFNLLLPIFPLDSAKLLRAGLSFRFNPQKVTYYMAQLGIGAAVVILLAGMARISLPFIGMAGSILMLIMVVAIQACVYVLRDVEYNQVYDTYDQWGEKPVYYDEDLMNRTRGRLVEDLRRMKVFGWLRPYKTRATVGAPGRLRVPPMEATTSTSRKPKGPARVVDAHPDPSRITDPAEIRALMRSAVEREDFEAAAKLKRRLAELRGN